MSPEEENNTSNTPETEESMGDTEVENETVSLSDHKINLITVILAVLAVLIVVGWLAIYYTQNNQPTDVVTEDNVGAEEVSQSESDQETTQRDFLDSYKIEGVVGEYNANTKQLIVNVAGDNDSVTRHHMDLTPETVVELAVYDNDLQRILSYGEELEHIYLKEGDRVSVTLKINSGEIVGVGSETDPTVANLILVVK